MLFNHTLGIQLLKSTSANIEIFKGRRHGNNIPVKTLQLHREAVTTDCFVEIYFCLKFIDFHSSHLFC